MVSQIDKEKNKKKELKMYIAVGLVAYVAITVFYVSNFGFSLESIKMYVLYTLLGITLMAIFIIEQQLKKHDNPDTVKGSAHLMNAKELKEYNKKFAAPLGKEEIDGEENMIISKDIRLAIDNRGTRRNCNILVIGGSGAGKSRFFASPNILQYNANFIITDPSGEMLRDYGKALEDNGYQVKVFNLTDVYRSNRYNPFHYIKEEKDVYILVNTLIKNTKGEGGGGEKFWEDSEKLLMTALILYLWHMCKPEDQTFTNVVRMLNMAEVDENDATAESPLDLLFKDLEQEDPENLAVQQYKTFKLAAGKTMKSILISVGVRLESFKLSDIKYLTETDDFKFEEFADTKQALFVIIPTADTTFNFLVSLLYSQLFTSLYTYAETRAEFSYMARVGKLDILKVVQAVDEEDSKRSKKEIEKFVNDVKAGVKIEHDTQKNLYKVYTKNTNELVGWRGTKEQVEQFVDSLKNIRVEKNYARCPIHVRLILDEFANIGQIPDFDQKLATMRKYGATRSIVKSYCTC